MLLTLELVQAIGRQLGQTVTLENIDMQLFYYKVRKGKTVQSFDTLTEVSNYLHTTF
jgi:hypothetical protein